MAKTVYPLKLDLYSTGCLSCHLLLRTVMGTSIQIYSSAPTVFSSLLCRSRASTIRREIRSRNLTGPSTNASSRPRNAGKETLIEARQELIVRQIYRIAQIVHPCLGAK